MNSLSWLIYAADIVRNVGFLFATFGVLGGVAGAALIMLSIVPNRERYQTGERIYEYEYRNVYPMAHVRPWGMGIALFFFVMLMSSVFLPSKEAVYMIAASQLGEHIVQLEEVQSLGGDMGGLAKDTIDLLRQQIQEQLIISPAEAK